MVYFTRSTFRASASTNEEYPHKISFTSANSKLPPYCSAAHFTGRKAIKPCSFCSSLLLYALLKLSRTAWAGKATRPESFSDEAALLKKFRMNQSKWFGKTVSPSFHITCCELLRSILCRVIRSYIDKCAASIGCLKRSSGCVRNWKCAALSRI